MASAIEEPMPGHAIVVCDSGPPLFRRRDERTSRRTSTSAKISDQLRKANRHFDAPRPSRWANISPAPQLGGTCAATVKKPDAMFQALAGEDGETAAARRRNAAGREAEEKTTFTEMKPGIGSHPPRPRPGPPIAGCRQGDEQRRRLAATWRPRWRSA